MDGERRLAAQERARGRLRKMVAAARTDPNVFVHATARVEGNRPIRKQAPVHREWQDYLSSYDRCILFAPVGHGKSSQIQRWRLEWEIGRNPDLRVGVFSVTQDLPLKFLSSVKADIEHNPMIPRVFPGLRPSTTQKMWTGGKIIVQRESHLPDPTIQICGAYGHILGSRLDLIVIDDLCNMENTLTSYQRDKLYDWLTGEVLSRLPPDGTGRVWALGHPWHEQDPLMRLARNEGYEVRTYASTNRYDKEDDEEEVILIPELWDMDRLYRRAHELGPLNADMMLWCQLPSKTLGRIRREWFDICLQRGRGLDFVTSWDTAHAPTYTGVDLGFSDDGSETAIFTAAVLPEGSRRLLDLRAGRWNGPEIVNQLVDVHNRYGSIIAVENNAAQNLLLQFASQLNTIPLKGHTCVDNETEALSTRGWLKSHQIGIRDEILTLNIETGLSEWKPVRYVHRSEYQGSMYRFESGSIDALCTPDHSWPRTDQAQSPLKLVETQHLNTNSVLPRGRRSSYDPEPVYDDDLVALVGWAVTEGHFARDKVKVEISQSPTAHPQHVKAIRGLLERQRAVWHEKDNGAGVTKFCVGGDIARQLRSVLGGSKNLPLAFILRLSSRQRHLLIDSLVDGDGWTQGSTRYLCSNTVSILEGFEMLCALEGYPSCRTYRIAGWGPQRRQGVCSSPPPPEVRHGIVSMRSTRDTYLQNKGTRPVRVEGWKGEIWCPSTVNGTFYARRNGITYFTGNTGMNKHHPTFGVEALGLELSQGKWVIPCDKDLIPPRAVVAWINEALAYSPDIHMGDRLSSSWICRECIRKSPAAAGVEMPDIDTLLR